jgi:hypothetical protein
MSSIRWRVILPLLLACGAAGCAGRSANGVDSGSGVVRNGDLLQGTGTVVWNPVEGGFYQIRGDDSASYDPTNLPTAYQKRDLRIRFTARLRQDLASYHMSGPIIEILSIDKL